MNINIIKKDIQITFKNIIKKYKLKSFYINNNSKSKSVVARFTDRLISSIVIFGLVMIISYFLFNNFLASIIISIQITIIYFIIISRLYKMRYKSLKEQTRDEIAKEMIYNELINKSPEDFIDYFKNVLKDLKFYNIGNDKNSNINIRAEINNKKVGIKCLQFIDDYRVNLDEVRNFFIELMESDFDEGIIITTTSFVDETKNLIDKINKHKKINLIGLDKLTKILENTKYHPKTKDIDEYILNKIRQVESKLKMYKNQALSSSKWGKYFLTSITLLWFGKYTNFKFYYYIFTIFLCILGTISLIKQLKFYIGGYKNKDSCIKESDFLYKE